MWETRSLQYFILSMQNCSMTAILLEFVYLNINKNMTDEGLRKDHHGDRLQGTFQRLLAVATFLWTDASAGGRSRPCCNKTSGRSRRI